MRFDIVNKDLKPDVFLKNFILKQSEYSLESIIPARSYWLKSSDSSMVSEYSQNLLRDSIDEIILGTELAFDKIDFDYLVQVSFKPGVTDNTARSSVEALENKFKGMNFEIASGRIFLIKSLLNFNVIRDIASQFLGNNLINFIEVFNKKELTTYIPSPQFPKVVITSQNVQTINLDLKQHELEDLSRKYLWALSIDEIKQIKDYYQEPNTQKVRSQNSLPTDPTDLEIEIIAQTWSEHCKHKIFNSNIEYSEPEDTKLKIGNFTIKSLFKDYIMKSTNILHNEHKKKWLISVFKDNAGIVRFDDNIDLCFKVETHNSPSALDPYGGALTGILGVNRDILGCGMGALPIANTNVLCFGHTHYKKETLNLLPKKLKNPISLLEGVHRGIEDGGNKSGIPTVNGAFRFHDNYVAKPLVYCGSVGVLPQSIENLPTAEKRTKAGDLIVVCGGSVGADGVHGATFSSLELNDSAPATAVQIGDPFTQKRLTDFLIEARDFNLYTGLTDNGAGGLSSSVGEMAELTNGAVINIESIPLKYSGLKPYEVIISESQERMTFSVDPTKIDQFIELATKRNVNPAVIGEFNNKGFFHIKSQGQTIALLDLNFLHNSLKPMKLKARFNSKIEDNIWHQDKRDNTIKSFEESIFDLISHPNIKSHESLVRQYDHEVKGSTIVKPFIENKLSSPSDAAVMSTKLFGGDPKSAIAIGNGLAPEISHIDTYIMTQFAIDEAIRNVVASGANPDFISLCDNFCWPDPIKSSTNPDAEHKLAQLVRSAKALFDTSLVYKTPFVSGKDSMKNDFIGKTSTGNNLKISIPPTLLISSLAKLDSIDNFMTSEFKSPDEIVYFIGDQHFDKAYFSTLHSELTDVAPINLEQNKKTFHFIHQSIKNGLIQSCHDVSEGGIICAIIESCFSNHLGFNFFKDLRDQNYNLDALLFNEFTGGFIISVASEKVNSFELSLGDQPFKRIGITSKDAKIVFENTFSIETKKLYKAWRSDEY